MTFASGVDLHALVLDAHYRQAYAAIGSLSQTGLRVGAVACSAESSWAPGLRSRWCCFKATVPDFDSDGHRYVDAVLDLLNERRARMILPSHDGSIQALRRRRADVERRTFFPLASEAALDIATSKTRTLALGATLGIAVPRSTVVRNEADIRAALNEFGRHAVIKPTSSWGDSRGLGIRIGADAVTSVESAMAELEKIRGAGMDGIIQELLPGRRDAVTVFRASGRIWARFAQTSYREFPPLGGASVLCESIPLLPDVVEPAEKLVDAANLDGCSMVEFRRDRAGRPVLMEVNARLPGSVALAISAGVNFPRLLYGWALGEPLQEIRDYEVGRRLRWLSGDVWYLKCVREGQGRPDTPSLGRALTTFFGDFVRRPGALDGVHLGDIVPALYEFQHGVIDPVLGRARRSVMPGEETTPRVVPADQAIPREDK
jgi:predicted ATP-grasp superfamily ATP-dependent carboligase